MMRRSLLVGLLVLGGCQGVVGPAQRRCLTDRIDNPCLTIEEQERRARDRLAFPEGGGVAPRTGAEDPFARGR